MTLLNNFLQEPEFECVFHPAWGKQFVPVNSSGSYQGGMQFIFVLKFSKLCRTKDTFTCIVPLVIWSNWQFCFLFSPILLCWKRRNIHKILWQINSSWRYFLFVFEPLVHSWMFAFLLLAKIDLCFFVVVLMGRFLNAVLFVLFTKIT